MFHFFHNRKKETKRIYLYYKHFLLNWETEMANYISEDQIEKAIIEVFTHNLGYRHINCLESDTTGRQAETDVVIKPLLRRKLADLNKGLPESAIDEAFEQLCQTRLDKSEFEANKEIAGLIKNGIQLEINNSNGRKETVNVKVVDFNEPTKNDYLVVSQLWIHACCQRGLDRC